MNPQMERFEQRKAQGYAPGFYMCKCSRCGSAFDGAKRAWCCEACADKAIESAPDSGAREEPGAGQGVSA